MASVPNFSSPDRRGEADNLCRKHKFPYEFWSDEQEELLCKKCVITSNLQTNQLKLVQDMLPKVRADTVEKIVKVNENLKEDIKTIHNFCDQSCKKVECVRLYKKKVQALEETLDKFIEVSERLEAERRSDEALVRRMFDSRELIESEADDSLVASLRNTLLSLDQPSSLPVLHAHDSNLCNLACMYTKDEVGYEFPAAAADSDSGVFSCASTSSDLPFNPTKNKADKLKKRGMWFVDTDNIQAALYALVSRQPRHLVLISSQVAPEPLPMDAVASVAKAARHCRVTLQLYRSFIKPRKNCTDLELLELFLNNSTLTVVSFHGHLDSVGIAKLPANIKFLGLSIQSAADSSAVSGLKPWKNLRLLDVSISSDVDPDDLVPLPVVRSIVLHFPNLVDDWLFKVRPSIEALFPTSKLTDLVFPQCKLSSTAAGDMVNQLRGLQIEEVGMEFTGKWEPTKDEKLCMEDRLSKAVKCSNVSWNLNWMQ